MKIDIVKFSFLQISTAMHIFQVRKNLPSFLAKSADIITILYLSSALFIYKFLAKNVVNELTPVHI